MDSLINLIYVDGNLILTTVKLVVFIFSLETMAYSFSLIGGVG